MTRRTKDSFFNRESKPQDKVCIALMGNFSESQLVENSDVISSFLTCFNIENDGQFFQLKNYKGVSFEFFLINKMDMLSQRSLFSKPNKVVILPTSLNDFDTSVRILKKFIALPDHKENIYYYNPFSKVSDDYTVIQKKAEFFEFTVLDKDRVLDQLSEISKKNMQTKPEAYCSLC